MMVLNLNLKSNTVMSWFFTISFYYILKFNRICLSTPTVPYFSTQIFRVKILKKQKFKVNMPCDRVSFALSESFLTFNICRVVFENFDLEN